MKNTLANKNLKALKKLNKSSYKNLRIIMHGKTNKTF